jgi:hypothetical protein
MTLADIYERLPPRIIEIDYYRWRISQLTFQCCNNMISAKFTIQLHNCFKHESAGKYRRKFQCQFPVKKNATCDFYLWRILKDKLYKMIPLILDEIRNNIQREISTIFGGGGESL